MLLLLSVFIFFAGLIIGSFLNCAAYRLYHEISFVSGRSFCPECKHTLAWYDLVPVFSFVFLKGKCRYCGKKISLQYPLAELGTGMIFLTVFLATYDPQLSVLGSFISLAYMLIISSLLIVIFISDLKWFIIPDEALIAALGVTVFFHLYNFIFNSFTVGQALPFLYSGLGSLAFFLGIFLLTKGKAMGFGDVKFSFFMGLFLGWPMIVVALFLAFFSGAIIGLILIALKKKGLKSEVPFGPFLIFGIFTAMIWGRELVNYYLSFLA
ncbi:MAG: prepilin peptidase [Candidatus Paceibacterota bacterium]|jgi:prepilin signal peptidase PulO-like enzyme (type II secretory pathway)